MQENIADKLPEQQMPDTAPAQTEEKGKSAAGQRIND